MQTYTVIWTIEIDAPDASIAASVARDIQLDPHNLASVFDVWSEAGECERIDLIEPDGYTHS